MIKTADFCYMIGVLQGDGCLTKYFVKDKGKKILRHFIKLDARDIEMVEKT